MTIKEVGGDITTTPEGINFIVHQANTHNVMGAGVALALRNKWPEVYDIDSITYNKVMESIAGSGVPIDTIQDIMLGGTTVTKELETDQGGPLRVINLYGQRLGINSEYGCPTDYDAVREGFKAIAEKLGNPSQPLLDSVGGKVVLGIPHSMGCGLAGGNWETYRAIIEEELKGTSIEIVIVKFEG